MKVGGAYRGGERMLDKEVASWYGEQRLKKEQSKTRNERKREREG